MEAERVSSTSPFRQMMRSFSRREKMSAVRWVLSIGYNGCALGVMVWSHMFGSLRSRDIVSTTSVYIFGDTQATNILLSPSRKASAAPSSVVSAAARCV